jgi:hypothetical protein
VVALVVLPSRSTAVDRSITELRRNDHFATSSAAGAALARISEDLLGDGRSCRSGSKPETVKRLRCDRRLAAAGWSSAAAVATLSCTQPGTQQIRRRFLDHLVDLRRAERRTPFLPPELPRLPDC